MEFTLIWQIAKRYLRGKRAANAVPVLSRISMVAIAVVSCAMIVVFSIFNGLETMAKGLFNSFYPEIKITTVKGKFFPFDNNKLNAIKGIKGVKHVTGVVEDNVFVIHHEQQKVITLKGITNDYFLVNNMRDSISGEDSVSDGEVHTAIVGQNIMNELGADTHSLSYLMLYYPNPAVTNPGADLLSAFQSLKLHPAGYFHISDEFDNIYILAPASLVQGLFKEEGKYSSIELSGEPGDMQEVKQKIKAMLGPAFKVETRYEQNKTVYMAMSGEKWAIYAILFLVLLIASFNMVGALSMLVLEKQKDIAILKAMGAQKGTIQKIFLAEGVMWSLVGGGTGITLAAIICLAQQKLGLLMMGGSFLADAYPVELQWHDFLLVLSTILTVGLLAAWYPSISATKPADVTLKST